MKGDAWEALGMPGNHGGLMDLSNLEMENGKSNHKKRKLAKEQREKNREKRREFWIYKEIWIENRN